MSPMTLPALGHGGQGVAAGSLLRSSHGGSASSASSSVTAPSGFHNSIEVVAVLNEFKETSREVEAILGSDLSKVNPVNLDTSVATKVLVPKGKVEFVVPVVVIVKASAPAKVNEPPARVKPVTVPALPVILIV